MNASPIDLTVAHIREVFSGEATGHDWWHIYRVWQLAKRIARDEGPVDLHIVELAALLHDIADWKFHGGDLMAGSRAARTWLSSLQVPEATIAHVCDIIDHVSFKGAGVATTMRTKEGQIVQDADRLDALGAIGIARTFAYGGSVGRELYNPAIAPEHHATFAAYKKSNSPSFNHFTEKILLLRDRMNTQTAKRLAAARHAYLEAYMAEFLAEWNGER